MEVAPRKGGPEAGKKRRWRETRKKKGGGGIPSAWVCGRE